MGGGGEGGDGGEGGTEAVVVAGGGVGVVDGVVAEPHVVGGVLAAERRLPSAPMTKRGAEAEAEAEAEGGDAAEVQRKAKAKTN